jgi:predicted transcriptional regulator
MSGCKSLKNPVQVNIRIRRYECIDCKGRFSTVESVVKKVFIKREPKEMRGENKFLLSKMEEKKITVSELSKRIGVSRYCIYLWLDGARISTKNAVKLCEFFGGHISEYVEWKR